MNFQIYFNGKNLVLHAGRVPSPTDHSGPFYKFIIYLQGAWGFWTLEKLFTWKTLKEQNKIH